MRGRTPLTHRAMITFPLSRDPRNPPQDPPHSYFITITISQHKMRIKIPKLLTKIMQKQFHGYERTKPTKILIWRKVFSIFTNIFGNNRSSVRGIRARDLSRNVKKVGVSNIESKGKTRRSTNICCRRGKGVCVAKGDVSSGVMLIGKWKNSGKLIKVSSKIRGKWRMIKSLRNMASKVFGKATAGEGEGLELCKKRIIMGSKCKPLNSSGTLQYDKNGFLLPEVLP